MTFTIRPFTDADYPALAAISNEAYGSHATAESLRDEISTIGPQYVFKMWVAEADGQVVGVGEGQHQMGRFHPRKFHLSVAVRKAYRGQGIGTALYQQVRTALSEYDPISLESGAKEDCPEGLHFLKRLGFVETMTFWESEFDLVAWDPAPFAAVVDQAKAAGYRFRSMADLEAAEPDCLHRIHALVQDVKVDVPSTEPHTFTPFAEWEKLVLRPALIKELYWVAFHSGEMVGLSTLWSTPEPGVIETGLTAVKRAHRHQGVARALKVVALDRAKAAGHQRVKTSNESNNRAMLSVNQWLGFVRKPGWVAHKLQLHTEEE